MYLWRAVDSEGEILDLLVQPRRDKVAALRLLRKLLKKQGYAPTVLGPISCQPIAARGENSVSYHVMSRACARATVQ
jgi:hypothetical protein